MKNPKIEKMSHYGLKVWKKLPKDKKRLFAPLAAVTGWSIEKQSIYITGLLGGWEIFDITAQQGADLIFQMMENIKEDLKNAAVSER